MTPKQFAALAAAAAVSLLTAILIYGARTDWSTETAGGGKLIPALETDAAKVARVTVTQGAKTLTIEKTGDTWLLQDRDGYPASAANVRALLIALGQARLLEPKTRSPDRYSALDVDDPTGKTTNARLIKLEDAAGATIAEIIAGKQRPGSAADPGGGAGTYVRRPGDDQSWLASTKIAGGAALRDWTVARVFETKTEKIKNVTVEVQGEPAYVVKRAANGAHELETIPTGKKIKYVNLVDNIVEAASFVDFESVRKAAGATGGEAGSVSLETDDGLKIGLRVRRDKDGTWTTVEASGEGDAKTAAEEIAARTKGWEFEIIPSKADTMLKRYSDLLEDAPS